MALISYTGVGWPDANPLLTCVLRHEDRNELQFCVWPVELVTLYGDTWSVLLFIHLRVKLSTAF